MKVEIEDAEDKLEEGVQDPKDHIHDWANLWSDIKKFLKKKSKSLPLSQLNQYLIISNFATLCLKDSGKFGDHTAVAWGSRELVFMTSSGAGSALMLVVDPVVLPAPMRSMKVSPFLSMVILNSYICSCPAMKVEWAKTKAHANWWAEEYILTVEEMQHVIQYCDWKAKWWFRYATIHMDVSVSLRCGLQAYAHKQAAMYQDLTQSFAWQ